MNHHWTRRGFTAAGAAFALGLPNVACAQRPRVRIFAKGLISPESPKPQPDGSIICVEMSLGRLSRVSADGARISVIANLGGSPNGVAIGPGGAAFVCNSGGIIFKPVGDLHVYSGAVPGGICSIQRVDLKTGAFTTLYANYDGAPLQGPNDLVFDKRGGFWFSMGRQTNPNGTDRGAIFWATPDGKTLKRVAWNPGANGIALSPDGNSLMAVGSGKVWAFRVNGPGELALGADGEPARRLLWDAQGAVSFDSMSVDSAGNAVLGTLMRGDVATSPREGFITVVSPQGTLVERVPMPDRFVTNIGFGGPDRKIAYASLTTTGQLAAVDWPVPGLKLNYT